MGGVCGAGVASTRCCSSASGSFCAAAVSAAETAWRSRTRRAFSAAAQRRFRSSAGIAVREVPCVESSRTCERIRCGESSSRRSESNTSSTRCSCACCSRIAGGEKANLWRLTNAFTFASARARRAARAARAARARRRGKVASLHGRSRPRSRSRTRARAHTRPRPTSPAGLAAPWFVWG